MIKVIYISKDVPAYDCYDVEYRPSIYFNTSDSWVGVWKDEWGVRLGNQILQFSNDILFEFWRPDHRADKIYIHKFENGLIYKAFPANAIIINNEEIYFSKELLNHLEKLYNCILHGELNNIVYWHIAIKYKDIPFIATSHGAGFSPINQLFKIRKKVATYPKIIKKIYTFNKFLKYIDAITYQTNLTKQILVNQYRMPSSKLNNVTMGTDFEHFKPINQTHVRSFLNISPTVTVLLSVCRLNQRKQIDKMIDVLSDKTIAKNNFIYIIVGNGTDFYERYLKKKAKYLFEKGKVRFVGFKDVDELVYYYNAADLFLQTAYSEAGPVTSMEATACEVPIFSTKTGRVAEILIKYNKGKIVEPKNYRQWKKCIVNFFNGEQIECLDRNTAYQYFAWPNVAKTFIAIYRKIVN